MPRGVLLVPLPSPGWSASLRFFFGGLGLGPKEEKPIAAAMSSGGEEVREGVGSGSGSGMLVVVLGDSGWVEKVLGEGKMAVRRQEM